jgi:pyruvate/2-oxoglutarate dehydrogenase complex dihydrolipoamide acyltransferase (E2) component
MPEVLVPRLNANDDELLVVEVRVCEGAAVAEGDVLFAVESMKAATEILAPSAGVVRSIAVRKGAMATVGTLMCRVTHGASADRPEPSGDAPAAGASGGVKITAKASQRARELGIDVTRVPPSDGQVGLKEVEAFAAKAGV